MGKKILVVAAHPDDEILGVGGTILRYTSRGGVVHIMILAEGLTSRDNQRNVSAHQGELDELHKAAQDVANFMGVQKLILKNFPDNRMDGVELLDVVKAIEEEVDDFKPDVVYTHHGGDVNIDHQIVHDAVLTACRPMPNNPVTKILFFETLSSTEWQMPTSDKSFLPNYYVDIENYLEKKIQALKYYESEMRKYPHSRSYEAVEILAKYRGFTIGKFAAEAFEVGRIIT